MNFLLFLTFACIGAVLPWVVYLLTPKKLRKYIKRPTVIASALIFVVGAYSASMSHGPKLKLQSASRAPDPEPVHIERGKQFIEHKDRIGQFDERLKEQ